MTQSKEQQYRDALKTLRDACCTEYGYVPFGSIDGPFDEAMAAADSLLAESQPETPRAGTPHQPIPHEQAIAVDPAAGRPWVEGQRFKLPTDNGYDTEWYVQGEDVLHDGQNQRGKGSGFEGRLSVYTIETFTGAINEGRLVPVDPAPDAVPPSPPAAVAEPLYYIFSAKHSHRTDNALWWRPEGKGYTFKLEDAGKFTGEGLKEQIGQDTYGDNVAMACDTINAMSFRAVDSGILRNHIVRQSLPATPLAGSEVKRG